MIDMKFFIHTLIVLSLAAGITSCSVEPEPIDYGKAQCDFCKMNIVDQQHSAQYVTKKGKQFKFDAIECMVRQIDSEQLDEGKLEFVLVADYSHPGVMIDVENSTFLISKAIKSPMGAYLTAFSNETDAMEIADSKGGDVYNWKELKNHFSKK
jgi:copper chaperone NosL